MFLALWGFAVELAKLLPIMYFVLHFELKPPKMIALCSAAAIVLAAICGGIFGNAEIPVGAYICIIFTLFVISGRQKILYTLVTYLGICLFDMLTGSVFMLVTDNNMQLVADNSIIRNTVNSFSLIAVIIIVFISRIKHSQKYYTTSRIGIFYPIMILLGETSILCFITAFQYSDRNNKILATALSFFAIVFMLICLVMILNYISKENYKSISEMNEKLLKNQENYYSMLLKKDRETVQFRHDIRNHINCMLLLFENKKYDELREYFDKIGAALSDLSPAVQTGNDVLNAIICDNIGRYPNVNCNIHGKFPPKNNISVMDLCTIFSNLLENAFFAANNSDIKCVSISFKSIGESFFCEIKNSVPCKINISGNILMTEKSDKQNHGFGTKNALLAAENNGGSIVYSCDEEYFTAEILLINV